MPKMKEQTYNRIVTGCLVVAVGSALLFEYSGSLNWLVGLIGLGAGVLATVLYLKDQYASEQTQNDTISSEVTAAGKNQEAQPQSVEVDDLISLISLSRSLGSIAEIKWPQSKSILTAPAYLRFVESLLVVASPEPEPGKRSPTEIAEIVHSLCTREDAPEYEFILKPDGDFLIRPSKKGRPMFRVQRSDLLEDFEDSPEEEHVFH